MADDVRLTEWFHMQLTERKAATHPVWVQPTLDRTLLGKEGASKVVYGTANFCHWSHVMQVMLQNSLVFFAGACK